MNIDLTLKNYRCFPDSDPARLTISDGWTAFLGVNNAGKSALLRIIYEFRNIFVILSDHNMLGNILVHGISTYATFQNSVQDTREICNYNNDRMLSLQVTVRENLEEYEMTVILDRSTNKVSIRTINGHDIRSVDGQLRIVPSGNGLISVEGDKPRDSGLIFLAFAQLSRTFYIGAFRNILNTGSKTDYFDIRVGDAFIKRWRQMQTGNDKSDNIACINVVNAVERLMGYDRLEIQSSNDDSTLHVSINGRPYKLHEIGSGIAQLIIVLSSVAIAKPNYILIDEPELNLHPSLQLDFLSELGKFASCGMLFSTHNIGLARASADRIYSIVRVAEGHSRVAKYENTPNLLEFLGALSYSSYQALGFDKILLVEGATEVRTIQQLLRKVKKEHRILLLPLGGSQLISAGREAELAEICRITPNVSVLIDSERRSTSAELDLDRKAFIDSCIMLKFHCCVLERRATENYLTEGAIRRVKGVKYSALPHFAKLSEVENGWSKSDNWRIAAEMEWSDIKDTDLGKFLEAL